MLTFCGLDNFNFPFQGYTKLVWQLTSDCFSQKAGADEEEEAHLQEASHLAALQTVAAEMSPVSESFAKHRKLFKMLNSLLAGESWHRQHGQAGQLLRLHRAADDHLELEQWDDGAEHQRVHHLHRDADHQLVHIDFKWIAYYYLQPHKCHQFTQV